jgi:hypothetical protein
MTNGAAAPFFFAEAFTSHHCIASTATLTEAKPALQYVNESSEPDLD